MRSQYVGEVIEQHTHTHAWVGRIRATKFNVFVGPGNKLHHIWLAQGIVRLPDFLAWILYWFRFMCPSELNDRQVLKVFDSQPAYCLE